MATEILLREFNILPAPLQNHVIEYIISLQKLQWTPIHKNSRQPTRKSNLSKKYGGRLSKLTGQNLQQHIIQSRDEWERNI